MASSSDDEGYFVKREPFSVKEEPLEDSLLWKSHKKSSAFSPFKPVTVLTNLQRGNVETQTVQVFPDELTMYCKAAMGEMIPEDFTPELKIDEKDEHGFTLLMWASFYGQFPTVKLILSNHATADLKGEDGETALILAASAGHHEIVNRLLSSGADPNHEDDFGNTALMHAASGDHAHCVSELLESGAVLNYTNLRGISGYNLAVAKGSTKAQIVMDKYLMRVLEAS